MFFEDNSNNYKKRVKMSIHEHDEDIDVVSSPEPSPKHSSESRELFSSTPIHSRSPAIDQIHERVSESPVKTESVTSDQGKQTTNASFTSFSISSILSKNETKKGDPTTNPFLPNINSTEPNSLEDAAMISR